MLNKEKYAKEIVEIAISGEDIAIVNNKPCYCDITPCHKCDFFHGACEELLEQWANSEYKEKEIDWSKVPVDTPIYVWDSDSNTYKRHFAGYANDKIIAFTDGATSWSNDGKTEWNHAQIKEGVDCSEWYKD